MKKILLALMFSVVSNTLVWAERFKDTVSAYRKHVYKIVLPLFINTAQQGHTDVQFNLGVAYDDAR
ncbi:MAG: hypothetical protein ABL858_00980 [Candidatus Nitrotoga sp.]